MLLFKILFRDPRIDQGKNNFFLGHGAVRDFEIFCVVVRTSSSPWIPGANLEIRNSFDLEAVYTLMGLRLVSLGQELVVSMHRFLVGFLNTIAIIGENHHLLEHHQVEILNNY